MADTYYTLRKAGSVGKPTYELVKWEFDRCQPLDVYVMWLPLSREGLKFHSCNCPSRSQPCKHWDIVKALWDVAGGSEETLSRLYYDNGVLKAEDIPDSKQLELLIDH